MQSIQQYPAMSNCYEVKLLQKVGNYY